MKKTRDEFGLGWNKENENPKTPVAAKRKPNSQVGASLSATPNKETSATPTAPIKSVEENQSVQREGNESLSIKYIKQTTHEIGAFAPKRAAWTASQHSKFNDPLASPKMKPSKAQPLPIITGANVTVDSPDPKSKFHTGSNKKNKRCESAIDLSPDDDSWPNDMLNDFFTEQQDIPSEGAMMPAVYGSNVTVDSPDPCSKFHDRNNNRRDWPPFDCTVRNLNLNLSMNMGTTKSSSASSTVTTTSTTSTPASDEQSMMSLRSPTATTKGSNRQVTLYGKQMDMMMITQQKQDLGDLGQGRGQGQGRSKVSPTSVAAMLSPNAEELFRQQLSPFKPDYDLVRDMIRCNSSDDATTGTSSEAHTGTANNLTDAKTKMSAAARRRFKDKIILTVKDDIILNTSPSKVTFLSRQLSADNNDTRVPGVGNVNGNGDDNENENGSSGRYSDQQMINVENHSNHSRNDQAADVSDNDGKGVTAGVAILAEDLQEDRSSSKQRRHSSSKSSNALVNSSMSPEAQTTTVDSAAAVSAPATLMPRPPTNHTGRQVIVVNSRSAVALGVPEDDQSSSSRGSMKGCGDGNNVNSNSSLRPLEALELNPQPESAQGQGQQRFNRRGAKISPANPSTVDEAFVVSSTSTSTSTSTESRNTDDKRLSTSTSFPISVDASTNSSATSIINSRNTDLSSSRGRSAAVVRPSTGVPPKSLHPMPTVATVRCGGGLPSGDSRRLSSNHNVSSSSTDTAVGSTSTSTSTSMVYRRGRRVSSSMSSLNRFSSSSSSDIITNATTEEAVGGMKSTNTSTPENENEIRPGTGTNSGRRSGSDDVDGGDGSRQDDDTGVVCQLRRHKSSTNLHSPTELFGSTLRRTTSVAAWQRHGSGHGSGRGSSRGSDEHQPAKEDGDSRDNSNSHNTSTSSTHPRNRNVNVDGDKSGSSEFDDVLELMNYRQLELLQKNPEECVENSEEDDYLDFGELNGVDFGMSPIRHSSGHNGGNCNDNSYHDGCDSSGGSRNRGGDSVQEEGIDVDDNCHQAVAVGVNGVRKMKKNEKKSTSTTSPAIAIVRNGVVTIVGGLTLRAKPKSRRRKGPHSVFQRGIFESIPESQEAIHGVPRWLSIFPPPAPAIATTAAAAASASKRRSRSAVPSKSSSSSSSSQSASSSPSSNSSSHSSSSRPPIMRSLLTIGGFNPISTSSSATTADTTATAAAAAAATTNANAAISGYLKIPRASSASTRASAFATTTINDSSDASPKLFSSFFNSFSSSSSSFSATSTSTTASAVPSTATISTVSAVLSRPGTAVAVGSASPSSSPSPSYPQTTTKSPAPSVTVSVSSSTTNSSKTPPRVHRGRSTHERSNARGVQSASASPSQASSPSTPTSAPTSTSKSTSVSTPASNKKKSPLSPKREVDVKNDHYRSWMAKQLWSAIDKPEDYSQPKNQVQSHQGKSTTSSPSPNSKTKQRRGDGKENSSPQVDNNLNQGVGGSSLNGEDGIIGKDIFSAVVAEDMATLKLLVYPRLWSLQCVDKRGNTPLMVAAQFGSMHALKFLLRRGAAINARNHYGNTALHFALEFNRSDVATYLLKKGADKDVMNDKELVCGVRG